MALLSRLRTENGIGNLEAKVKSFCAVQHALRFLKDFILFAEKEEELHKLLDERGQDYRGIIVTMIHKFRDLPANLNTRKNIFVLIDEAHRTTGGDLGNFLMAELPNATFIGFTGTPVDKTAYGKGTVQD